MRVPLLTKAPFECVRAGVSAAEAVNVAPRDETESLLRLQWSKEDEEEDDELFTCPVAMSPRSRTVRPAITRRSYQVVFLKNVSIIVFCTTYNG